MTSSKCTSGEEEDGEDGAEEEALRRGNVATARDPARRWRESTKLQGR
eukprot:CAMPEP_0181382646 /NCGR_PEP_ID=MMETSP1106-20121128/20869_1 /TAXON_ID=81844 /ORGANISM="Mantoniella antarctica, Strain SL-175" /LENGTH=47 /DNA_ID= /DNA_START= /DNA_END= /DNA_ORIENTATION=